MRAWARRALEVLIDAAFWTLIGLLAVIAWALGWFTPPALVELGREVIAR